MSNKNSNTVKFALIGAAGAIGNSIAAAIRSQGHTYRVVGRNRAQLEKHFGADPLAESVAWNPDDPASVRSACRGVDTLIYLVGVPYDQFQLHPVLMQKTLDGAIAEGVKRIVLIGTVYPYGRPTSQTVNENHPRAPHTFKGRMRKAQEDLLLKAHAEGKIQGTVVRLPDFYGPGVEANFLHSLFQAAARGGVANMIGPIDVPHEYVYVPDVGPVVLALAAKPEAYGRWWNFAGAGAITQREIADKAFALAGRPPKIRVAGKTMLRLIGLFKPFMREMVEMYYLLTTPVLMDDRALCSLLGNVHKTSYEDGIRASLKAAGLNTTNG
jgi:nucleoside-diphosphate-sugar epimerase